MFSVGCRRAESNPVTRMGRDAITCILRAGSTKWTDFFAILLCHGEGAEGLFPRTVHQ